MDPGAFWPASILYLISSRPARNLVSQRKEGYAPEDNFVYNCLYNTYKRAIHGAREIVQWLEHLLLLSKI